METYLISGVGLGLDSILNWPDIRPPDNLPWCSSRYRISGLPDFEFEITTYTGYLDEHRTLNGPLEKKNPMSKQISGKWSDF